MEDDYRTVNRASWDERVPAHAASPDYQLERFAADPGFLSEVVRFDLPRLGDISGLRGVHLQCHIGTDTVSLARLGASMTGLDFSAPAVEQARRLAQRTGADADVRAGRRLRGRRGARRAGRSTWCSPVSARCAGCRTSAAGPGGRRPAAARRAAVPARGPPDAVGAGRRAPGRPAGGATTPTSSGRSRRSSTSAAPTSGPTWRSSTPSPTNGTTAWARSSPRCWTAGLKITALTEHDSVPWEALPGKMDRSAGGEWRLADQPWRLAHSYTLQAVKRG